MFTDGECLHATIKYAYKCISFTPIKPKNIFHMKRALDFCGECTEYIITDKELDDGPNAPLINFSVYTHQGRFEKHGTIINEPNLCKLCEENDDIKSRRG